jgi:hypothetical protein
MASVSVSATQSNSASVSQTSTATNNGAVSTTLADGSVSLNDQLTASSMAAIQMVDVHLPTTDGRTVILSRYTEPEPDQALLLQMLSVCPTNRRQGSCLMALRYRNDRDSCGADLAGPNHGKPPAWRIIRRELRKTG